MNKEDYLKKRIDCQIEWYDKKAIHCKKYHDNISITSIFCSSISSVICIVSLIFPQTSMIFTIISSLISLLLTTILALDKLKKYQELHTQYRTTCEKLKQEKFLYLTYAGEYYGNYDEENFKLFVNRCESIMSTEIGTWAQLNEKKQS